MPSRGHPVFAWLLTLLEAPLQPLRAEAARDAEGRVLDVGAGTGANLELFTRATEVTLVDPDPYMLKRARERLAQKMRSGPLPFAVHIVAGEAESLPVPDTSVDTVLFTFSLCTVRDPRRALEEARRVLAPGGHVRFVEHARDPRPLLAGLQDVLSPAWGAVNAGCHLGRDIPALLRQAGFRVHELRTLSPAVYPVSPVVAGVATPEKAG